jgi:hypothetical protein
LKPVVLTVSIPASVFTCQVNTDEEVAQAPSPDIPELQVLGRYAGHWEDEIAGRPDARRTESAEWILDGRFLRQLWSTEADDGSPKASGITMMTFDTASNVYRSWSFLATGSVIENEGVWDAATQTMTWGHRVRKTSETVITKASFAGDATQA